MVVSQQQKPHIVVRRLETSKEELVLGTLFSIVRESTLIFQPATADVLCWSFFHCDDGMIHILLYKAIVQHIFSEVSASDSRRIHTATIEWVGA